MDALEVAGVPRAAMRFLKDHSTIDLAHNRLMQSYAETPLTSKRRLESAIYAMRTTGRLYAAMVECAFRQADAPEDYGTSTEEVGKAPA